MGVEEVRYLIDKMLSRTPDRLIRLTQVYSQVFFVVCVNFRHIQINRVVEPEPEIFACANPYPHPRNAVLPVPDLHLDPEPT